MSSKQLKVYFLTTGNSGTAYYRMWQYKEAMNRLNLASAIMPWYNSRQLYAQDWQWHVRDDMNVGGRKGVVSRMVAEADVVVVQYLHTMEALCLVEALKALHPRTVFLTEIDDYILDTPTYNEAFSSYSPGNSYRDVVVEQMKALDGVIVSTPYLAEAYAEFNDHIYVVPNGLDLSKWPEPAPRAGKTIRIGWGGGASHADDLSTIEEPIKRLLARRKGVEFHVVHGVPEFFKEQSRIVAHQNWWYINKWPTALRKMGFDIGIAPLTDNSFNRAKSNLRKLEYAGLRIPVVAANVGEFARTCKTGKDGFLYSTADEFEKALDTLIDKPDLRRLMGQFNFKDVERNFNTEKITADYVDILKEAHARGQTTTVDVSDHSPRRVNKWIAQQPASLLH